MRSNRGYTLIELLIVVGMIGIVTAISVPVFMESNARSALWTGSELMGATIRQARLKAISSNATYRLTFACPGANQVRYLVVTGDPAVDNDEGRCGQTVEGDSGIVEMPTGIAYSAEAATALEVTGRGVFTAIGDSIPLTISVTHGSTARTLAVSGTGQITFTNVE